MTRTTNKLYLLSLVLGLLIFVGSGLLMAGGSGNQNQPSKGGLISFDYRDADIDSVLQFLSMASGLTVVKDPSVTGTVTIINKQNVTFEEALTMLNSILEVRGYTILSQNDFLKVVPMGKAAQESPVKTRLDSTSTDTPGEVVTQIVPLRTLKAEDLQKQLSSLFTGGAAIIANAQTNTLVMTDYTSHLRRITEIINELEKAQAEFSRLNRQDPASEATKGNLEERLAILMGQRDAKRLQIAVIPLVYADASVMARELSQIMQPKGLDLAQLPLDQLVRAITGNQTAGGTQQGNLAGQTAGANAKVIESLLNQLKNQQLQLRTAATTSGSPFIENRVVADIYTNSLIVTGAPEVIAEIQKLVGQLDRSMPGATDRYVTFVYNLKYATAQNLANVLNQVSQGSARRTASGSGWDALWVVGEPGTNSLVITTTRTWTDKVKSLIEELDQEPAEGDYVTLTFRLKNAQATDLANVLNQLFGQPLQGTGKNQVVLPLQMEAGDGGVAARLKQILQERQGLAGAILSRAPSQSTQSGPAVRALAEVATNSLLVTAPGDTAEEISRLVADLDAATPPVEPYVNMVYKLTYADSAQLATVLNQFFAGAVRAASGGQTGARQQSGALGLRVQLGGSGQASQASQSAQSSQGSQNLKNIWVTSEPSTNSLLIAVPKDMVVEVEDIIARLDVKTPANSQGYVSIYKLRNARASDLANLLNDLFMGSTRTYQTGAGSRTQTQTQATLQSRAQGSSATQGQGQNLQQGQGVTAQGGGQTTATAAAQTASRLGSSATTTLNALRDENVRFVPDLASNSLLIIASPEIMGEIKGMLEQLDVMPPQVMIEAMVVEVSLDEASEFGIEWTLTNNIGPGESNKASFATGGLTNAPGFKYSIVSTGVNVVLQALNSAGRLNVLSTPRIVASNNSSASINIGQQVPYLQSSKEDPQGNVQRFYAYKTIGIVLEVTPRIGESDNIFLDLYQTTDNVMQDVAIAGAPLVATREAKTSVVVKNGQTLVIGGMIRENVSKVTKKVPVLGDLPIIGKLFTRESVNIQKTELMVFITPRIIRTEAEAAEVTEAERSKISLP